MQLLTCYSRFQQNVLHAELGHPLEVITSATGRAMGHHLTDTFKSCEDCALGKRKKSEVHKKAVERSNILTQRLFIDISSSLTPTYGARNIGFWLYTLCSASLKI